MRYLSIINDLRKTLSDREPATEYGHVTETDASFFLVNEQRAVNITHEGETWTARIEDYSGEDDY